MDESYYNWAGSKLFESNNQQKTNKAQYYDKPVIEKPLTEDVISEKPPKQPVITITDSQDGPPPVSDKDYIPGYLKTLIGRNIRAEFIIGTNQFVDKAGILREVGANYFVLEDYISHAMIMSDLYSVKFVTVL